VIQVLGLVGSIGGAVMIVLALLWAVGVILRLW
jgi:hypothetical protein